VLYAKRSTVRWVHRGSRRARISSTLARPFASPFARARLSSRVHPSRTLLLFRVPSRPDLARSPLAQRPSSTCLGFVPHRDFTPPRPHTAKRPTASLRSVLRLSQPPDGFLRDRACRLISSRCHVQDWPVQGLLLSRSPRASSTRAVPPCRCAPRAHRPKSAAALNALGFEALFRVRSRSRD